METDIIQCLIVQAILDIALENNMTPEEQKSNFKLSGVNDPVAQGLRGRPCHQPTSQFYIYSYDFWFVASFLSMKKIQK